MAGHEGSPDRETPHERAAGRICAAGDLDPSDPLARVIRGLVDGLESAASAETYGTDLAEFLAWLRRRRPPVAPMAVERPELTAYLRHLAERVAPGPGGRPGDPRHRYAPDTRRRKIAGAFGDHRTPAHWQGAWHISDRHARVRSMSPSTSSGRRVVTMRFA